MKTSHKILTLSLSVIALVFLTSCGTKKSETLTPAANSVITTEASKPLASCNQLSDTNFRLNVSVLADSSGQINPDWIKVKFLNVSTDLNKSGYHIRFYKWRVMANAAQLDPTSLSFTSYQLATGQTNSNYMTAIYTSQINLQNGFYVKLNDDPNYPYQVLKVVAYKSDGTVAAQSDLLIPQFFSQPSDYQQNSDGSARVQNLVALHPLSSVDVSAWTGDQVKQYFAQFCF